MRLQLPDQQLRVSPRLPAGTAVLAALAGAAPWPWLGAWSLLALAPGLSLFLLILRFQRGSWIRVSQTRGISWRLEGPFRRRLGSVALDPAEIGELSLEASLPSRLLGLQDLRILRRDGTSHRFRGFEGVGPLAEALHAVLQQAARR
ncbi:MAG TPA: hypothetical protein VFT46_09630 [Holophagaceae bacterium]|nr:hypothetical protein [Holophagaceae bacterium]